VQKENFSGDNTSTPLFIFYFHLTLQNIIILLIYDILLI